MEVIVITQGAVNLAGSINGLAAQIGKSTLRELEAVEASLRIAKEHYADTKTKSYLGSIHGLIGEQIRIRSTQP